MAYFPTATLSFLKLHVFTARQQSA